ncbi:recombinase family protein [Streptomyces sp. NPDC014870]|uniref:recombinase family protein n=1 Tax=Streptomyces sp. NPDC014870 TaxID=3364925 RepID=UPI0036F72A09
MANIGPRTAEGGLMHQVVGVMAEFERSLIRERTRAGLDAAKALGISRATLYRHLGEST